MASRTVRKCRLCNEPVKKGGVREDRVRNPFVICDTCLDYICPDRGDKPLFVDRDGNLYVVDDRQEKVTIFFNYGESPYSSHAEVHTDDILCGCDQYVAPPG